MIEFALTILALAIFFAIARAVIKGIPDFLNEVSEIAQEFFGFWSGAKNWLEAWPSMGGTILALVTLLAGEWWIAIQLFVSGLIIQIAYSLIRGHFSD